MIVRFFICISLFAYCSLSAQTVNYHADIAPILRKNCVTCHRAGQVGPMPLTSYAEVSPYAKMIAYVTETGLMPPFIANAPQGVFKDEKHLSAEEIGLFKKWLESGLSEGKPPGEKQVKIPPPAPFLTEYDTVIGMTENFEQYGVYYDQFRVFVLPTDFAEDKIITATEFVPGSPNIVRGCSISADRSDRVRAWDEWDPQYGYYSFGELGFVPEESRFYNWYPGKTDVHFPEGTGRILPAGTKLLLHIHYGPTGVPQRDSSHIRLQFADRPPAQIIRTFPLINPANLTNDTFLLPAGAVTRMHASFTLPFDTEIFGLQPHAHFLAQEWEIFAVLPGRNTEVLFKTEEWDFHHKQKFTYRRPKILPAGTVIHALTTYDNTAANLFNPNEPPRTMTWGKRMYEEMFLVFFDVAPAARNTFDNLQILYHPANVTDSLFSVQINLQKREKLSVIVSDFAGERTSRQIQNQPFPKGKHRLNIPLRNFPPGNYYLTFQNRRGEEKHSFFVYLAEDTF